MLSGFPIARMYPLEVCTRFYSIAQPQTFTWNERVQFFETEEYTQYKYTNRCRIGKLLGVALTGFAVFRTDQDVIRMYCNFSDLKAAEIRPHFFLSAAVGATEPT